MSFETLIKRLENIMRGDDLAGKVQYLKQIVWMIFLKIYDAKELEWEWNAKGAPYVSIIPEELKWRSWAEDDNSGKAPTGPGLLDFVNNKLFPTLKNLSIEENTPRKHKIVKYIFEDAANYMKNGTKLRQMINALNEVDFTANTETHEFGDLYEGMLKDLQESKRDGGEFYTPRALTDFIVEMIKPELGQKIGDFACGTGGFLVSTLKYLEKEYPNDHDVIVGQIEGIEKKSFPYSLCLTNLILHDVDEPKIFYDNSLKNNVTEFEEESLVDIIVMNPPYGGNEDEIIKQNFPTEHRSSETADLFMSLIMHKLRENGRAGVVLSDGFFGCTENANMAIKKDLFKNFNLEVVLRLPRSVFAPYTTIATNVLFFTKNSVGTKETWFYRMDLPKGYKAFSKTKPIQSKHFDVVREWWNKKLEIADEEGNYKSKKYSLEEIKALNYDVSKLCGFTNKTEEVLEPDVLISEYIETKESLNVNIASVLAEIKALLGE